MLSSDTEYDYDLLSGAFNTQEHKAKSRMMAPPRTPQNKQQLVTECLKAPATWCFTSLWLRFCNYLALVIISDYASMSVLTISILATENTQTTTEQTVFLNKKLM